MDGHEPPKLDTTLKTDFLRRTCARAMTPRGLQRARALRELERLLFSAESGFSIGMEGHLLGSIARKYPISARAIVLELRGQGPQRLVEVAEQIELGIRIKTPRRQQKT